MNDSADREKSFDQTLTAVAGATAAPTDDQPVHMLVRQGSDGPALQIELGSAPVTIGRADGVDVRLADPRLSKRHCQLCLINDRVHVTDLGSTNGTFVDLARLPGSMILPVGARLRVGDTVFLHELRSRRELQKLKELESDLRQACAYVQAMLPPPWPTGPVQTDWCFIPCAILGGDAFGYHNLDGERLALYLLDVCGHGVNAAMHSVSVLNALRQQALPHVDFGRPAEVLRGLNAAFDMERHNEMYFSLWYGVYDRRNRSLGYASAGHPPALLVGPQRGAATPLQTRGMAIGTLPDQRFRTEELVVEPGSSLYIFSDGVYEIVTRTGAEWSLAGFQDLVLQARVPGTNESVRLQLAIERLSRSAELADDFSLLVVEFN